MQKEIQLQEQQKKNEQFLEESTRGIYLKDNHAKMIWQGNKKIIVDTCAYPNVVGKNFYVIGSNNCYGIVKVTQEKAITLKQFSELEAYHKISELESKEWFKGKKILFAYSVEPINMFSEPKTVSASKEKKLFSNFVQFLSEEDVKQNLFKYDPKEMPTNFLKKTFVLTVDLLKQKKLGEENQYSQEDLDCYYFLLENEFEERQEIFPYEKLSEDQRKIVEQKILEKKSNELATKFLSCKNQQEKIEFIMQNKKQLEDACQFDVFSLQEKEFFKNKNFFSQQFVSNPKVCATSEDLLKELFG